MAIVEGSGTSPFDRLSPEAVWVLHRLYSKFKGFNRNNLSLTYDEVSQILGGRVYSRSLWQLIGFGFVDVERFGRLERTCTIFALSNRWRKWLDPSSQPGLDQIAAILKEIEDLKREKWPEGRKSEKRQRITALRKSLFEE
jgi:hypothetical protein